MNSPFVIALIAASTALASYHFASAVANWWLRSSLQLAAFVLAILLLGALSATTAVSAGAGQYFFYIMVVAVIFSRLFTRKG